MTLIIKKVILGKNATSSRSRRGAYYRVVDKETGTRTFYKIAGKRGAKSKLRASDKFAVAEQKRREQSGEATEDATLHFRLDYGASDARSGHQFKMKDSYITAQVKKGDSDEDVRAYLRGLFNEAFSNQFGGALKDYIKDDDLVEGLERGQGNSDGIRIKYNYGGDKWKVADTKPGIVQDIIEDKEEFFYKTLRRVKK